LGIQSKELLLRDPLRGSDVGLAAFDQSAHIRPFSVKFTLVSIANLGCLDVDRFADSRQVSVEASPFSPRFPTELLKAARVVPVQQLEVLLRLRAELLPDRR
jgi:hypothetical protein